MRSSTKAQWNKPRPVENTTISSDISGTPLRCSARFQTTGLFTRFALTVYSLGIYATVGVGFHFNESEVCNPFPGPLYCSTLRILTGAPPGGKLDI